MKSLLGTAALVGGALLVTLGISTILDVWLMRPQTAIADSDGLVEKSPLAAATRPAASPVTRSRTK